MDTEEKLALPGVSSIEIDFELAGYLAAKRLGEEMLAGYLAAKRLGEEMADKQMATGGRHPQRAARRAPVADGDVPAFGPLLVVRRKSTSGTGRHADYILEAVEMIRRRACDGLTVAALAAKFKCSRRLFDMRFREAMGHSARDEIEHVRFENAFSLLKSTDTPVSAIADFCGYRTASALRHIFLARTGTSMRAWRAKNHL